MITGLDFWYDGQQRRFLEQIVRAFSGFHYETGWRDNTPPQQFMVPCRIASTDRMVANIIRNASENTLLSVPMITVHQTGLALRRDALGDTTHSESIHVTERAVDPVTGKYTAEKGRTYTVKRLMPRPFLMTVQVDVWTSNMLQKHQLSEQILTVITPDFYIQNSDNGIDWSAFTLMELDDISWSSRSIPVGTQDEIDVMTLTLKLPFWLSPPAQVKQQRLIQQIVTNISMINQVNTNINQDDIEGEFTGQPGARIITTPGNHFLRVEGNRLTLLGPRGGEKTPAGADYVWADLLSQYGALNPTISQIRLKTNPDLDQADTDIIGSIQPGAQPNELVFHIDIDTLPANTQPAINGVVDPLAVCPGNGLPNAVNGQRYLLINDVSDSLQAWGVLDAKANDIIQYQNGNWTVAFEAGALPPHPVPQYVLNLNSGRQLRWTGHDWVLTIDGDYPPGMWRLAL